MPRAVPAPAGWTPALAKGFAPACACAPEGAVARPVAGLVARPVAGLLACALTLAFALVPLPAAAQAVVGSVGVASADRYRGLESIVPGPVLRAGASLDTPMGLYASGAAQWLVDAHDWGRSQVLVGWTHPVAGAWSLDTGVARSFFGADHDYDFTEWMVGAVHPDGTVRAWWSRHYFGQRPASVYVDGNASFALSSRWRAVGHLGWLTYIGTQYGYRWDSRADALAGLAWSQGDLDVRLTVDGLLSGRPPSAETDGHTGAAVVLAVSRAF